MSSVINRQGRTAFQGRKRSKAPRIYKTKKNPQKKRRFFYHIKTKYIELIKALAGAISNRKKQTYTRAKARART